MTLDPSLQQQYQTFIDEIIVMTLGGKIRSKNHVYKLLVERLSLGTGEIFERCLSEQQNQIQLRLDNSTDEAKKAKASRQLRALETIAWAWEQWQKDRQETSISSKALEKLILAPINDHFSTLLEILDPNQAHVFSQTQIEQLAKDLKQRPEEHLQQIVIGLEQGLKSLQILEVNLMSWIYNQRQSEALGFDSQQIEPWRTWSKQVTSPIVKQLFELQSLNQSAATLTQVEASRYLSNWVELAVTLRGVQRSLVQWFDQQPYNAKWGKRLSSSTLMTFAVIWCELSNGFAQTQNQQLSKACFQVALQLLRSFSQRPDFPLYGGIFASFSGENLRNTLSYLDEPLQYIEGTQEKGRILTLLGYSQHTLGQYDRAITFHQQALEIARNAGDFLCEIANLNHLSRISIKQKALETAISYSQRALILARQKGDRLGEANGLANLGYSEVLASHQREEMLPEVYEKSIEYLKEALKLSEQFNDDYGQELVLRQTQALCCNSLGIAYIILEQPQTAIRYLEKGFESAQMTGDLYLQGLNFTYLAEAYYNLNYREQAFYSACVGMYLLERISAREWRQNAGLLVILENQIGTEAFQALLKQQRSKLTATISYDGFDYIPQLLEQYRQSQ